MLRSSSYAVAAAGREGAAAGEQHAQVTVRLRCWQREASEVFLEEYFSSVQKVPGNSRCQQSGFCASSFWRKRSTRFYMSSPTGQIGLRLHSGASWSCCRASRAGARIVWPSEHNYAREARFAFEFGPRRTSVWKLRSSAIHNHSQCSASKPAGMN